MIRFVKAKRTVLANGQPTQKYVARIYRNSNVTMDEIAKEISHATTLSYPDVIAALKAFELHVAAKIQDGSAIKFDYLGMFIPKIVSASVATKDDVNQDIIKRKTVRFYPSVAFKEEVAKAQLQEAEPTPNV